MKNPISTKAKEEILKHHWEKIYFYCILYFVLIYTYPKGGLLVSAGFFCIHLGAHLDLKNYLNNAEYEEHEEHEES